MYVLIGAFSLLFILWLTGRKSVHHEVNIQASPETVWKVITDMDQYPQWNPVMRLLEGKVEQGNQVKYLLTQDEDTQIEIRATIAQLIPEQLMRNTGGNPLLFSFDHTYTLQVNAALVKVIIHENYTGIGVNFWNTGPIKEAYRRLNIALKERCENATNPE